MSSKPLLYSIIQSNKHLQKNLSEAKNEQFQKYLKTIKKDQSSFISLSFKEKIQILDQLQVICNWTNQFALTDENLSRFSFSEPLHSLKYLSLTPVELVKELYKYRKVLSLSFNFGNFSVKTQKPNWTGDSKDDLQIAKTEVMSREDLLHPEILTFLYNFLFLEELSDKKTYSAQVFDLDQPSFTFVIKSQLTEDAQIITVKRVGKAFEAKLPKDLPAAEKQENLIQLITNFYNSLKKA